MNVRDEIVRRHLKGHSYGQIARALKLSRSTIGGHLRRWRIATNQAPKPPRKNGWTDEQIDTLFQMHLQGHSTAVVGIAVGKSSESVRKQGHRLGLSWADRVPRSQRAFVLPALSEKQAEVEQRRGDDRLVYALALAFQRGDHLPANTRQQMTSEASTSATNNVCEAA